VKSLKLRALITLFALSGAGVLSAQEISAIPFKVSIGLGAEVNKNTVKDVAFAGVLTYDFAFTPRFSGGSRVAFSHNFDDLGTLEAELALRFYFFSRNSSGPFAQANGGVSFIVRNDDTYDDMDTKLLCGGTVGWRLHLDSFYIEPYARTGYPFVWGGGLIAGVSL
jgi:hypothetical protein